MKVEFSLNGPKSRLLQYMGQLASMNDHLPNIFDVHYSVKIEVMENEDFALIYPDC